MPKFRYLTPQEYDALNEEQKQAYINAALDHRNAQKVKAPQQQQQQQQQQPPEPGPAKPDKDGSGSS